MFTTSVISNINKLFIDCRQVGYWQSIKEPDIPDAVEPATEGKPPDVGRRPTANLSPKAFEKRLSEVSCFQEDRGRLEAKRSRTPLTCGMVL
jgi:hypothetical protein